MTSTLSQLLLVYVLGGLTFIPLVLAIVLVPAWLALPKLADDGKTKEKDGKSHGLLDDTAGEKLQASRGEQYERDVEEETASGTFAVLRKYDFPAAAAALAAKYPSQSGGTGVVNDGTAEAGGGSESVYQTMYRSVFDRTRGAPAPNALANTSDDESAAAADARTRRKANRAAPANVYFIVLRHGHLMLYDSPAQLEVRHVISLAHHRVTLSDGESDGPPPEQLLTEGDLFIKRTAILLRPSAVANGTKQMQAAAPKPFYLFTSTSIQKESFYHALVLSSPLPPTPQPLDPHDLIKLQTSLHSTVMTAETRALNAIISRIFLALSGTEQLKDFFRSKVEKKISRVQKPGFINALALQAIDLGNAAPVFANLRLKDLNISGDLTISCDVRYTGGISLALAAQARLDLGPRFKPRTVDLLLSSSLKRLSGHMLIRIKPPPSNRLWFCFDGMPDMEIKIEPVVSTRQITYGFILRQIEERIRLLVAETLVKPNMDDIPFYDTRGQDVRAGLWAESEGDSGNEEFEATDAEVLANRGEKTMSMPALTHLNPDREGASSGTDTPRRDQDAELKRRSFVSLPGPTPSTTYPPTVDSEDSKPTSPALRPFRSPSLTSPSVSIPSVALDDSSANYDPSYKPPPRKAMTWGRRHMASPPTRKEAVDAMREMRDRTVNGQEGGAAIAHEGDHYDHDSGSEDENSGRATPERTDTRLTSNSTVSSASASTASTAPSTRHESQKKATNLLAAATTATTAAKNWSWNAIQNRATKNAAGRRSSEAANAPTPQEPMGRGQPLPPPGTPLPGPQREKSLWAGSGFGVPGLSGSVKRKPLLPRRQVEKTHDEPVEIGKDKASHAADEFGAWEENSGDVTGGDTQPSEQRGVSSQEGERRVPPPLPKRPTVRAATGYRAGHDGHPTEPATSHALDAARLATFASARQNVEHSRSTSEPEIGSVQHHTEAVENRSPTSSSKTFASSSPSADLATYASEEPDALPAQPADTQTVSQRQATSSDPDDLVVVAAPVESGRNTPVPSEQPSAKAADSELSHYDGNEWEGFEEDDDVRYGYGEGDDEDDEEGMPKASFSRSRDDGFELHQ